MKKNAHQKKMIDRDEQKERQTERQTDNTDA